MVFTTKALAKPHKLLTASLNICSKGEIKHKDSTACRYYETALRSSDHKAVNPDFQTSSFHLKENSPEVTLLKESRTCLLVP